MPATRHVVEHVLRALDLVALVAVEALREGRVAVLGVPLAALFVEDVVSGAQFRCRWGGVCR